LLSSQLPSRRTNSGTAFWSTTSCRQVVSRGMLRIALFPCAEQDDVEEPEDVHKFAWDRVLVDHVLKGDRQAVRGHTLHMDWCLAVCCHSLWEAKDLRWVEHLQPGTIAIEHTASSEGQSPAPDHSRRQQGVRCDCVHPPPPPSSTILIDRQGMMVTHVTVSHSLCTSFLNSSQTLSPPPWAPTNLILPYQTNTRPCISHPRNPGRPPGSRHAPRSRCWSGSTRPAIQCKQGIMEVG
jgi:hypothetical protein